jgi:hypothetical protein
VNRLACFSFGYNLQYEMNTGNVAIFASGGGSNALKIIECLENDKDWGVALIITNK